jgi:hypothetical protein
MTNNELIVAVLIEGAIGAAVLVVIAYGLIGGRRLGLREIAS